ncbi:MAG: mechanosensitive ion channel [Paludibacteraceae bacterium]|nr:mechanosensitive ion channel [Paludibacteraceae bacterium]
MDELDSLQTDSVSVLASLIDKEAIQNGDYDQVVHTIIDTGVDMLFSFTSRVVLAVIVFFILKWIIKKLNTILKNAMEKKNTDVSLASFLNSLVSITLNFLMIIIVIGILGIETSSFVALFASAGVAIGMALSGTLQNFAGGVMIMLFKPYSVGDFLEAQGVVGTVKEIQIFNTLITTTDNKVIIVPNGGISTGIITNYSKEKYRRVDFEFSIGYGDDYDKAKTVLMELINEDTRILKGGDVAEPFIALKTLNSSSVDIVVRVWVEASNYWGVYFAMNESVYKEFSKQGLNIPYPQMDVHVHQA